MQVPEIIKEHKKIAGVVVLAVIVVVLTGMMLGRKPAGPTYLTVPVQRGNITATVQATGTVNPLTTAPVGSYVSGNVKYIFADFNTRVQAGQVLAQIDPAPFQAAVMTAQGNLAAAKANLANLQASLNAAKAAVQADEANAQKAQANLEYSVVNARRTDDLYKQGIISHDQNDLTQSTLAQNQAALLAAQAQTNQDQAKIKQVEAQIDQAKGQVEAATGTLRQAQTNLDYTTIVSPIDGVVVARNVVVGQAVASSLQAQTAFSVAQNLERMQVYAQVDESDTGNIKVGTPCTFQVDAFPTDVFHGQVNSTRLDPTTVQNVVTYDVIIDFQNPNEKLLPGETAYVTIPTGHARNALVIPNSALIFTPSLPPASVQQLYRSYKIPREAYTNHLGGWQVVWKLAPNKKDVTPVAIQAGITDLNHTQVLKGDLHEGDLVISSQTSGAAAPSGAGGQAGRRGVLIGR
ncbi:MAG TPA: efflux RND transporter periplasmic adaptor subunit [Patescibacteria group bacterium]|nr:efflux RND transporter periplasmic adaptor subunit [Patescibacteria group bacterium]